MISIHQRVFLSALIALSVFIGISAWVLEGYFTHYTEANIKDKLQNYVYSLLATAQEDQQGRMRLPEILPDPKLNQPDSGTRAYIKGETDPYQWFSASIINSGFNAEESIKALTDFSSGQKLYSKTTENYSRFIYTVSWEDYQSIE